MGSQGATKKMLFDKKLNERKPYTFFANFSNKVNAVENVDVAGADVAEKEALMEELCRLRQHRDEGDADKENAQSPVAMKGMQKTVGKLEEENQSLRQFMEEKNATGSPVGRNDEGEKVPVPLTDAERMALLDPSEPEQVAVQALASDFPEEPKELLLRFLRARKHDLEAARTSIQGHLVWRSDLKPDQVELGPSIQCPMETGMWRFMGIARGGEPVLWIRVGRYCPNEFDPRCLQRYISFFIRHSELQMRGPQCHYVVFDMKGWKLWMAGYIGHLQALIEVAQNQYPERAKAIVLVNAPWAFRATFSVIQGMLDPLTREKLVVLEKDQVPAYFGSILAADVLIDRYGGQRPAASVPVPNIPGLPAIRELSTAELEAKGLLP